MVALSGLWLIVSYLMGRYSRPQNRKGELGPIIQTSATAFLILAMVVVGLRWGLESEDPRILRAFVLPCLATLSVTSCLAQVWAQQLMERRQHWILIGERQELTIIEKEIQRDRLQAQLEVTALEASFLDHSHLSLLSTATRGVAVSEQSKLDENILEWLLARRGEGTKIVSLVNWSEQMLQRVPPELFNSRWLVHAEGFELQPERFGWRVKRVGDLVVGSILLTVSLPLIAIACVLITFQDGGPMFYYQNRTGLYGKKIRIRKLRSMRMDAEATGVQWAKIGDNRITPLGRWLRQIRLDEVPQLLSVLRGEMSLIGPRPERPEFEASLEQFIPHYRVRHWIRPGLSGWAQVCYPYGASLEDSRQKLSYDLYYLRNASLPLDLLILFKTIRMILRGKGAEPISQPVDKGP